MSIDFDQLREHVVRPTLEALDSEIPYSRNAENLILGTIAQESNGIYLKQLGSGPALGFIQMEPATCIDIWNNFLTYRSGLSRLVKETMTPGANEVDQLVGNLYYAVAMCRVHYFRAPDAVPGTIGGLAAMWKKVYNTHLGAGTEAEFKRNYRRFIGLL